jgi:small subunit ribosomal protein S8
MKVKIAKILKEEGYILNYKSIEDRKQGVLRIYLKYTQSGKPVICGIKRISKPSLRIYKGYENMPKTIGSLGIAIVSTSKGLLTDAQAKIEKAGGEIIGYIW